MRFIWREIGSDPSRAPVIGFAARGDGPPADDVMIPGVPLSRIRYTQRGNIVETPVGLARNQGVLATPGRGAAVAVFVQTFTGAVDTWGLQRALVNEFEVKKPLYLGIMRQHRQGGILAVAHIIVRYDPSFAWGLSGPGQRPTRNNGPVSTRLSGLFLHDGVYAQPRHALYTWQHRPRIVELPGEAEYADDRYFWGMWEY